MTKSDGPEAINVATVRGALSNMESTIADLETSSKDLMERLDSVLRPLSANTTGAVAGKSLSVTAPSDAETVQRVHSDNMRLQDVFGRLCHILERLVV